MAAAKVLLGQIGLTVLDLKTDTRPAESLPTVRAYLPVVTKAATLSTRKTWIAHWATFVHEFGDSPIDLPTASDLKDLAHQAKIKGKAHKLGKHGVGAMRSFIDAIKFFYRCAVDDKLIAEFDNPARRLRKPPSPPNPRRALTPRELSEVNESAMLGRDPELDTLVLRFHIETACRIGGIMNLRREDLNNTDCTVKLHEKGDMIRDQPISRTLMDLLLDHDAQRRPLVLIGGELMRRKNGLPLSKHYYDSLWQRIGKHSPWVEERGVTSHWLRHTTLTWVERHFGYGVAAAFAGHVPNGGVRGNTLTYVKASVGEVAAALSALTGELHPLAIDYFGEIQEYLRSDQSPIEPPSASQEAQPGDCENIE